MKKFIADTNFFLRYLLNDIPSQAKESEKHLKLAEKGKIAIFIPQIIVFEIAFVLSKVYKFSKNKTLDALKSLLITHYLNVETRKTFLGAIKIWQEVNIDFVDAFLLSLAKETHSQLLTFDKKLKKLPTLPSSIPRCQI